MKNNDMKRCKITVLKTTLDKELVAEYGAEGLSAHPMHKVDQVYYTDYINELISNGFEIREVVKPQPSQQIIDTINGMKDELRRPMMLIVSAIKK